MTMDIEKVLNLFDHKFIPVLKKLVLVNTLSPGLHARGLFILCLEVLLNLIKNNPNIKGSQFFEY